MGDRQRASTDAGDPVHPEVVRRNATRGRRVPNGIRCVRSPLQMHEWRGHDAGSRDPHVTVVGFPNHPETIPEPIADRRGLARLSRMARFIAAARWTLSFSL